MSATTVSIRNRCCMCGYEIEPRSGLDQLDEPDGLCPECYLEVSENYGEPETVIDELCRLF